MHLALSLCQLRQMERTLTYLTVLYKQKAYKFISPDSIFLGTKLKQKFTVRDSMGLHWKGLIKRTLSDTVEKYLPLDFYKRWRNAVQLPGLILILHKGGGHYIKSWVGKESLQGRQCHLHSISISFLKCFFKGHAGANPTLLPSPFCCQRKAPAKAWLWWEAHLLPLKQRELDLLTWGAQPKKHRPLIKRHWSAQNLDLPQGK